MKREEIVKHIRKNLNKIHIGDEFPTQRKLFAALEIPDDGNGNNTTRHVVSLYIKWEHLSAASKKIRIVEIENEPHYVDGRTNNGGAHNEKYGTLIKPVLLRFHYKNPVTYTYIFENIYDFGEGYFKIRFSSKDKHRREYFDYFKNYLKSMTKNALDSLQQKGYLRYKEVFMIKYGKCFLDSSNCHFDKDTLLISFLENIWEDQEQIDSFISFLDSTISEDERHEINADVKWENISLLDFARLIVIRKENLKFIEEFDKITVPYESDPVIAEPRQEEIIISTEDTLCRIWGYKRQAMAFNSAKVARVYNYAGVIYKLLGWKAVWKAFDINVLDRDGGLKEYPLLEFSNDQLLQALEPQIIHWVTEKTINPNEVAKKEWENRPRKHKPIGPPPSFFDTDEDISYLARDKKVNELHCKIFKREKDSRFLLNLVPEADG